MPAPKHPLICLLTLSLSFALAHASVAFAAEAILSSVRVIRDYGYTGLTPPALIVAPELSENTLVWQRRRLDGAPGYYLSIELLSGTIAGGRAG